MGQQKINQIIIALSAAKLGAWEGTADAAGLCFRQGERLLLCRATATGWRIQSGWRTKSIGVYAPAAPLVNVSGQSEALIVRHIKERLLSRMSWERPSVSIQDNDGVCQTTVR